MDWGYYCRTCGVSSRAFYASADDPRRDVESIYPLISRLVDGGEDVALPTVKVAAAVFLTAHKGHDLWAECEMGVLRLIRGAQPKGRPRPPRCISSRTRH